MSLRTLILMRSVQILLLLALAGCSSFMPKETSTVSSPWKVTQDIFTEHGAFSTLVGQERFELHNPVAIAVSAGVFYLVDADRDHVIRYDTVSKTGSLLIDLNQYAVGPIMDIFIHDNEHLFLADPQGGQVLEFDIHGKYERTLSAPGVLRSPVGVTVNRIRNDIYVADGGYDHIVIFTMQGEPIATLGERGMDNGQFRSLTALTWSEDGVYVSMRAGGRIQLLDHDGNFKQRLQTEGVLFPSAMATDRKGRLYVSDLMSNDIKVYDHGKWIKTLGGTGNAPGRFQRITDLWIDQYTLYVVDSLNGRIQSLPILE